MTAMRVEINETAIEKLLQGPDVRRELQRRTTAIAEACNAESSWGGYESAVDDGPDGPVGRVWSIAEHDEGRTKRTQRMIRNLDAE